MSASASMMVIPSVTPDLVPQILMDIGGMWREMSPIYGAHTFLTASEIKKRINEDMTELAQQIEQGGQFSADSLPLISIGKNYYTWLVPSPVQEVLKKVADSADEDALPVLRIHMHTQTEWVPWELFHDGTDFLGLRFQIARLPIVQHALDNQDDKPRQVQQVSNLLGNNLLESPAERTKWEGTFSGLVPEAQERRYPPVGSNSGYPTVQEIKSSLDSDIFHITCHGIRTTGKDKEEEIYYWTLDHTTNISWSYHITLKLIENITLTKRPLVFGNACGSNAVGLANPSGLIPSGFGAIFFGRGALNFIGTIAPITRAMGLDFAPRFYQRLLGANGFPNLPIGQALVATKRHYRDTSHDPSYLFYCLYGPPETRFTR
jgi:hypothetical protein